MLRKRLYKILREMNRYGFAILVCALISLFLNSCISRDVLKINIDLGEIIVEALSDYEEDNNIYPSDLEDLVPEYLDEIPSTSRGGDFFYTTISPEGFRLSFLVRSSYGCGYLYKINSWECGRGVD